jgi:O-antigen/teichoic acid export membrane protein
MPTDFGIIAMASLVINLADVLLSLGVNVALIQNRNASADHYSTAWTLRLLQSVIAALIVFIAAPDAAVFFNDPRIISVLHFMAAGMLLLGLENIGTITFQKEMRFWLDFRFMFLKRIAGFFATILFAWVLRSYWALIIGTLVSRVLGVLLSYQMHSMRPYFSLRKIGDIFSVSQWMLVNNIGIYLSTNLNKMFVGHRSSTAITGGYTLADDVSSMPTSELLAPLNRVLFPAFVNVANNSEKIRELFLLAQSIQCLIGIPAGIGLALVAHDAVFVLLGEKWLFVAPFIHILAFANVIESVTTSGNYALLAMGYSRNVALVGWIKIFVFLLLLFIFLPNAVAIQIAWARVAADLGGLIFSVYILKRALRNIRMLDLLHSVERPLLGTAVMAAVVISAERIISLPPPISLIINISAGMISFATTVMAMWWLSGKPDGAESYLGGKAKIFFRSINRS